MSLMMSDDASDLPAALAGDQDAFARLYDRHAPMVLSLCRRLSPADAEDAMQDTFIRAYRKLHQLDRPAGFGAWLYAIARRVCSERRRSAQRRDRHQAVLAANVAADPPATSTAAAEQAERLDRLTDALNALPDDQRLAIHLHYLAPDPPAAAAATLGLSRSGFYRLLADSRQRLATLMLETRTT